MAPVTKNLKIKGRVQGVGFRYSFQSQAERLGLKGWVRNCRDGSVEAVVQGPETDVEAIVEWAGRGPDMAQVEHVEISETLGEFFEFSIRDTL